MRELNEVSLDELLNTLRDLRILAEEKNGSYRSLMFTVFSKCELAGDMYFFIRDVYDEVPDEVVSALIAQHEVILALCLLMRGYKPGTYSKAEEEHRETERESL